MNIYDKIIKGRDIRINELGIECDEQASQIKQLKDEIKQLERFRDNLKCCGNCIKQGSCKKRPLSLQYHPYCNGWHFDRLSQKNRKID